MCIECICVTLECMAYDFPLILEIFPLKSAVLVRIIGHGI